MKKIIFPIPNIFIKKEKKRKKKKKKGNLFIPSIEQNGP
jgi:hypothetical protein